jgi:general secretion pathway protein I
VIERSRQGRERGFSLLEVLVAFSILALSLGALLLVFSTGLRNTALAADYTRAVSLAESKLAEVGARRPLAPGASEGNVDGRYRWQAEVTELAPPEGVARPLEQVRAYQVSVTVTWGAGARERQVGLASLRFVGSD